MAIEIYCQMIKTYLIWILWKIFFFFRRRKFCVAIRCNEMKWDTFNAITGTRPWNGSFFMRKSITVSGTTNALKMLWFDFLQFPLFAYTRLLHTNLISVYHWFSSYFIIIIYSELIDGIQNIELHEFHLVQCGAELVRGRLATFVRCHRPCNYTCSAKA